MDAASQDTGDERDIVLPWLRLTGVGGSTISRVAILSAAR